MDINFAQVHGATNAQGKLRSGKEISPWAGDTCKTDFDVSIALYDATLVAIANERAIASAVARQAAGTTLGGMDRGGAQGSAIARAIARIAADARDAPSDSPPESPLTTPPSSRASSPDLDLGASLRASPPNARPGGSAPTTSIKHPPPAARPITSPVFATSFLPAPATSAVPALVGHAHTPTASRSPEQQLRPARDAAPPALLATTTLPAAPSSKTTSIEKAWRREKERKAKLRKKLRLGAALDSQGAPPIKPALVRRWVQGLLDASVARASTFSSENMAHTRTAYQGLKDDRAARKLCRPEEMEALGLEVRHWDASSPAPICDSKGRVIAVCVAQPRSWECVNRDAVAAIKAARKRLYFPKKSRRHRRGDFPALAYGVSYGGGQQVPGNLQHSQRNEEALKELLEDPAIQRIAGLGSSAFNTWAPKAHQYYRHRLGPLFTRHPHLRLNFKNSIFPCCTVNFGPRTCCYPHVDSNNLPFGWCAITALGDFDYKRGGHLILWDLKLAIEFPPGATILIPSACLRHSNARIQKGETRYSFTQYAAGGLFRWVDHGFQPEAAYQAGWSEEREQEEIQTGHQRWQEGLKLFSTVEELRSLNRSSLPPLVIP
ncbi:hypothetical protein HWV62_22491 [Athelia sp. TMB]|nr:hypothetical protein HWV62_22491 [Athelia sp. TMB]